jgi:hypothetical protein
MAAGDGHGPLGFSPDPGEEDERPRPRPEPAETVAPQKAPRSRWGASAMGVVALLGFVVFASVAVLGGGPNGPGARGLEAGRNAPPFAAPLALGRLDGDVNVASREGAGEAGRIPACSVRGHDVLNACELWRTKPAAIAFFAVEGSRCVREVDLLERIAARHPGVAFAAVALRGEHDRVARIVRRRRWRFAVGFDRDGILANLYGVAVCPQVTFIRRGGRVAQTAVGELDARALEQRFAALAARGTLPGA